MSNVLDFQVHSKLLRGSMVSNMSGLRVEEGTCITYQHNTKVSQFHHYIIINEDLQTFEVEDDEMLFLFQNELEHLNATDFSLAQLLTSQKVYAAIPFEAELWSRVVSFINHGKNETALVLLYEQLSNHLKDTKTCDKFLLYVMPYDLSSDVLVHILNVLSSIRSELTNWKPFLQKATMSLEKKVGSETTKTLLKVIR